MSLTITKTEIPLLDEGVYPGVCVAVIDLGMQYNERYKKFHRKLMFIWEIPEETFELDGETLTRTVSQMFTASLSEKSNLRKSLESWMGRALTQEEQFEFRAGEMVGQGCYLQIIHKCNGEKTYANIANIMQLPKGVEKPTATSEPIIFDLDEPATHECFDWLPAFAQKMLEKADDSYKCANIASDQQAAS